MSKHTVEQFKRMLARIYGRGCVTGHSLTVDGNYIDYSHNEFEDVYAESVGVMIDEDEEAKMISATLSQQAEWPSDADARSVLIDWFGPANPYTNREVERMRAALQSVRPPAKPDADPWESRELGADERYVGVVPNSTPDAVAVPDTPRYREWRHLREHGVWSNGVPDWAKDHGGRMNDYRAACSVIEELAHRHARQVPDGWALVPIQMTEEMDRAGWPADTAQEGWERAIKAAPPAPEKD